MERTELQLEKITHPDLGRWLRIHSPQALLLLLFISKHKEEVVARAFSL